MRNLHLTIPDLKNYVLNPKMQRSGISELLEIVFHYILYAKKVYPEKIFEKRIKCNLPIWKCKHPAVCFYITNFLAFLEKLLGNEPSVEVSFVIIGKTKQILEEFVFEIVYPKPLEKGKDAPKFKIADLLSSISFALNSVGSSKSHSLGYTFELQIRSDCAAVSLENIEDDVRNEKFPWNAVKEPDPEPWTKITPLQTVDNPRFKIQIYQFQKEPEDQK